MDVILCDDLQQICLLWRRDDYRQSFDKLRELAKLLKCYRFRSEMSFNVMQNVAGQAIFSRCQYYAHTFLHRYLLVFLNNVVSVARD